MPIPPPAELRTPRLVLRRWTPSDLAPFAAINADARVMAHFEAPLDQVATAAMIARFEERFSADGIGQWAVERDGRWIGFAGLAWQYPPLPFAPAVEVGWRFAADAWGQGFAYEAAAAAIDDGFARLPLDAVVAMTASTNARSIALMRRLGMRRDPADDFDHPAVPTGHRVARHVLYRLPRDAWQRAARPT